MEKKREDPEITLLSFKTAEMLIGIRMALREGRLQRISQLFQFTEHLLCSRGATSINEWALEKTIPAQFGLRA